MLIHCSCSFFPRHAFWDVQFLWEGETRGKAAVGNKLYRWITMQAENYLIRMDIFSIIRMFSSFYWDIMHLMSHSPAEIRHPTCSGVLYYWKQPELCDTGNTFWGFFLINVCSTTFHSKISCSLEENLIVLWSCQSLDGWNWKWWLISLFFHALKII